MLAIEINIILILTGIFIGIISAMVGIGGGLLTVPILMFFFNFEQSNASAVSTLVIVFTSSSGALTYFLHKKIDLRTGVYFALIAVPSAFIGGLFADYLPEDILRFLFGLLMILVALRKILSEMNKKSINSNEIIDDRELEESKEEFPKYGLIPEKIEKRLIIDKDGTKYKYNIKLRNTLLGVALGGLIGGMLGVGGGVIFVPVLNSIGGVPPHISVATSTFTIVFSTSSASIARILGGSVQYEYVIPLAIGSVFGARFGALKVKKISSRNLLIIFYIVVLISGIRTLLSPFF